MKKLSNTEAALETSVAYEKSLYLSSNVLLFDNLFSKQYGFRKGFLPALSEKWKTAVYRSYFLLAVLKDPRNVFDCGNYELVIAKLSRRFQFTCLKLTHGNITKIIFTSNSMNNLKLYLQSVKADLFSPTQIFLNMHRRIENLLSNI